MRTVACVFATSVMLRLAACTIRLFETIIKAAAAAAAAAAEAAGQEKRRHKVLPTLGLLFVLIQGSEAFRRFVWTPTFTQHLAWYRHIKPPPPPPSCLGIISPDY